MDDKITAVAKFAQSKTAENVRSFCGLAGYYRPFIKNFAARANSSVEKGYTFSLGQ